MAKKTNAERQQAYRERRATSNEGQGERRINMWVRMETTQALERLARHYGLTKRETLERIVEQADQAELDAKDPTSGEFEEYLGVVTQ